ncbi:MAG TPA: hypothetical protein IAC12_03685 [Candidatus Aphodovivens avistercoris]|nr:hypothetical protein [Candidatus Aphodovivens avistercoris]
MTNPRTWTTGDLKKVAELAGTMPERELRRRLKLSKNQLHYAVTRLKSLGVNVTTRYYEPRLGTCPVCGCRRATLEEHGICEPCRLKRQLAEIEWRISDLMARLTPEQRAVYEKSEAQRESRADPMPKPRPTDGLDGYERAKASEEHDAAMEAWAAAYLKRRVKAAQKRKERIQEKVNENDNRRKRA